MHIIYSMDKSCNVAITNCEDIQQNVYKETEIREFNKINFTV